jgi:hypothetical protein
MKRVHEMNGPKSVSAWALLFNGKAAGKVVANWSNNRNGTVCSASVYVYGGPLDLKQHENKNGKTFDFGNVGKAGGYGYDKLSQAVWQCFNNAGVETKKVKPGNGCTREEFEAWGYEVIEVI